MRNILLFIVLGLIIYFGKKYFVDIDGNRWYMIIRLIIIGLVFYGIIAVGNLGMVKKLKREMMNLRK